MLYVHFSIELLDPNQHSWLCHKDFALVFSEIQEGSGHVVYFQEDPKKNPYYHNMLEVVSDYLAFMENLFR